MSLGKIPLVGSSCKLNNMPKLNTTSKMDRTRKLDSTRRPDNTFKAASIRPRVDKTHPMMADKTAAPEDRAAATAPRVVTVRAENMAVLSMSPFPSQYIRVRQVKMGGRTGSCLKVSDRKMVGRFYVVPGGAGNGYGYGGNYSPYQIVLAVHPICEKMVSYLLICLVSSPHCVGGKIVIWSTMLTPKDCAVTPSVPTSNILRFRPRERRSVTPKIGLALRK